jgi:hypothetical protein
MTAFITPEEMAACRRTALAREQARQAANAARRAAALIRQQFGAMQVVVFDSTVHGGWFAADW